MSSSSNEGMFAIITEMNQHNSEIEPSMDLPKPQTEGLKSGNFGESYQGEVETVRALEMGSGTAQPVSASNNVQVTASTSTQVSNLAPPAGFTMPMAHDLPDEAQDTDRIEREWVEKAKEIITRTNNDPHTQSKEMNRVKADYLRKRYNKEVKLTENS